MGAYGIKDFMKLGLKHLVERFLFQRDQGTRKELASGRWKTAANLTSTWKFHHDSKFECISDWNFRIFIV